MGFNENAKRAIAIALGMLVSSCAIRTSTADHYLGPTLYRRGVACRDGADVTQVVQIGGAAETGRQWGVSLGIVERVAASPRDASVACPDEPGSHDERKRWHFSPIYVRIDGREAPRFVHRSVIGTQAVVGAEATGVSVGAVSATLLLPPPDAFCAFHYDASDPTGTRFIVWNVRPEGPVPEEDILKEVQP